MLRLLSSKDTKLFGNHFVIQWKALAKYPQTSEYPCARVLVIFSGILDHFVLAKLATSSISLGRGVEECRWRVLFLITTPFSLITGVM